MPRPRGRRRLTVALLVVTSVTVITLDARGPGSLGWLRSVTRTVTGTVGDALGFATTPVRNVWGGITRYPDVLAENRELRLRIDELTGQAAAGVAATAERDELFALHGLEVPSDVERVDARVVGGPVSLVAETIEIDVGSDDGVTRDMPVVGPGGLVGRVVETSGGRSLVRLLTDRQLSVGVRLVGSGDVGVATGQGRGEPLRVDFVDPRVPVEVGELVVTSGLDTSLYPPGIVVGTVATVHSPVGVVQQDVTVTPAADLDSPLVVSVLLWEPPR